MNCKEAGELLGAYFDDELDMVHSIAIEKHLRECPDCTAALERQHALRAAIRAQAPYYNASPELRSRLRSVRGERRWFVPQFALAAATVLAAFVIWRAVPPSGPPIEQDVVAAHLRSLQANHLMDVPSSDRHTVKPWFTGRLDYAPDVTEHNGFTLDGGRLDYLNGRPVAALVYKRRLHVINVFTWPAPGEQAVQVDSRQGFHIAHWKHNGMQWWAVSDLSADELKELAR